MVRETREVRQDGVLVAKPTTELSRGNRTFTTFPLTVPSTPPGGRTR
jgi:hypothetical protein